MKKAPFVTLAVLLAFNAGVVTQAQDIRPSRGAAEMQKPGAVALLPLAPRRVAATSVQASAPGVNSRGGEVAAPAPVMAAAPEFDVRRSDKTVREVLVRWSALVGWDHQAEHWTADRDLPIVGTADASTFGPDFRGAVRKLMDSTGLTDRPLQPCFYTNRVLRVVALSESCDRVAVVAQ